MSSTRTRAALTYWPARDRIPAGFAWFPFVFLVQIPFRGETFASPGRWIFGNLLKQKKNLALAGENEQEVREWTGIRAFELRIWGRSSGRPWRPSSAGLYALRFGRHDSRCWRSRVMACVLVLADRLASWIRNERPVRVTPSPTTHGRPRYKGSRKHKRICPVDTPCRYSHAIAASRLAQRRT